MRRVPWFSPRCFGVDLGLRSTTLQRGMLAGMGRKRRPIGARSARCHERSRNVEDEGNALDGATPEATGTKDPAEQEALARDIGEELTDVFVAYVRGDISFADLTFLTYETLENLHIVAGGEYELEYEDEDEDDDDYDVAEATAQQEDLAQEPARGA